MIVGIVVGIVVILVLIWVIATTNSFRKKEIRINEALSGIEVALAKRYDMLTKLLDVAKGYAAHEKDLFTQVIELRRGMSAGELSEKNRQIDSMAASIFALAENYPQLRSSDVFIQLQAGIRDAEEHLQAARRLYNSNITAYNTAIAMFPASILAGSREAFEFFEAEEHKHNDVKMEF